MRELRVGVVAVVGDFDFFNRLLDVLVTEVRNKRGYFPFFRVCRRNRHVDRGDPVRSCGIPVRNPNERIGTHDGVHVVCRIVEYARKSLRHSGPRLRVFVNPVPASSSGYEVRVCETRVRESVEVPDCPATFVARKDELALRAGRYVYVVVRYYVIERTCGSRSGYA